MVYLTKTELVILHQIQIEAQPIEAPPEFPDTSGISGGRVFKKLSNEQLEQFGRQLCGFRRFFMSHEALRSSTIALLQKADYDVKKIEAQSKVDKATSNTLSPVKIKQSDVSVKTQERLYAAYQVIDVMKGKPKNHWLPILLKDHPEFQAFVEKLRKGKPETLAAEKRIQGLLDHWSGLNEMAEQIHPLGAFHEILKAAFSTAESTDFSPDGISSKMAKLKEAVSLYQTMPTGNDTQKKTKIAWGVAELIHNREFSPITAPLITKGEARYKLLANMPLFRLMLRHNAQESLKQGLPIKEIKIALNKAELVDFEKNMERLSPKLGKLAKQITNHLNQNEVIKNGEHYTTHPDFEDIEDSLDRLFELRQKFADKGHEQLEEFEQAFNYDTDKAFDIATFQQAIEKAGVFETEKAERERIEREKTEKTKQEKIVAQTEPEAIEPTKPVVPKLSTLPVREPSPLELSPITKSISASTTVDTLWCLGTCPTDYRQTVNKHAEVLFKKLHSNEKMTPNDWTQLAKAYVLLSDAPRRSSKKPENTYYYLSVPLQPVFTLTAPQRLIVSYCLTHPDLISGKTEKTLQLPFEFERLFDSLSDREQRDILEVLRYQSFTQSDTNGTKALEEVLITQQTAVAAEKSAKSARFDIPQSDEILSAQIAALSAPGRQTEVIPKLCGVLSYYLHNRDYISRDRIMAIKKIITNIKDEELIKKSNIYAHLIYAHLKRVVIKDLTDRGTLHQYKPVKRPERWPQLSSKKLTTLFSSLQNVVAPPIAFSPTNSRLKPNLLDGMRPNASEIEKRKAKEKLGDVSLELLTEIAIRGKAEKWAEVGENFEDDGLSLLANHVFPAAIHFRANTFPKPSQQLKRSWEQQAAAEEILQSLQTPSSDPMQPQGKVSNREKTTLILKLIKAMQDVLKGGAIRKGSQIDILFKCWTAVKNRKTVEINLEAGEGKTTIVKLFSEIFPVVKEQVPFVIHIAPFEQTLEPGWHPCPTSKDLEEILKKTPLPHDLVMTAEQLSRILQSLSADNPMAQKLKDAFFVLDEAHAPAYSGVHSKLAGLGCTRVANITATPNLQQLVHKIETLKTKIQELSDEALKRLSPTPQEKSELVQRRSKYESRLKAVEGYKTTIEQAIKAEIEDRTLEILQSPEEGPEKPIIEEIMEKMTTTDDPCSSFLVTMPDKQLSPSSTDQDPLILNLSQLIVAGRQRHKITTPTALLFRTPVKTGETASEASEGQLLAKVFSATHPEGEIIPFENMERFEALFGSEKPKVICLYTRDSTGGEFGQYSDLRKVGQEHTQYLVSEPASTTNLYQYLRRLRRPPGTQMDSLPPVKIYAKSSAEKAAFIGKSKELTTKEQLTRSREHLTTKIASKIKKHVLLEMNAYVEAWVKEIAVNAKLKPDDPQIPVLLQHLRDLVKEEYGKMERPDITPDMDLDTTVDAFKKTLREEVAKAGKELQFSSSTLPIELATAHILKTLNDTFFKTSSNAPLKARECEKDIRRLAQAVQEKTPEKSFDEAWVSYITNLIPKGLNLSPSQASEISSEILAGLRSPLANPKYGHGFDSNTLSAMQQESTTVEDFIEILAASQQPSAFNQLRLKLTGGLAALTRQKTSLLADEETRLKLNKAIQAVSMPTTVTSNRNITGMKDRARRYLTFLKEVN